MTASASHDTPAAQAPSSWVRRWSHLVADGARVLDVACGGGRHLRWFAGRGARVTGVDRDAALLARLRGEIGGPGGLGAAAELVAADLETAPWPFGDHRFGAVVVTRYLWRPLLPAITTSVDAGGVLLYDTFAHGQETVGRPARADFLLAPGELLAVAAAAGLRVVAYEDGFLDAPPRFVQRLAAVREAASALPPRYPLDAGDAGADAKIGGYPGKPA